uniref:Adenine nucleotide alpha hydrolase family protein n=1 Tax=Leptospirillum ferriphilum TaxID=178606 RepID=A0A7C3LRZ5_9BACT
MKCRVCRGKAVIDLPRHNASFCPSCFDSYLMDQVWKAIDEFRMFHKSERILIAVSGGKDSLALWDILNRLGYRTIGFHLDLGIGDYSRESTEKTRKFALDRDLPLHVESLAQEVGASVDSIADLTNRPPCSACGVSKRHLFNRAAKTMDCQVVATGHNLDDEASRLLGNILHWQDGYLEKQNPALPDEGSLVRKVKPLNRLTEKEMAAYAFLKGIDYVVHECPMSVNAKQLFYKKIMNEIEQESPGTKQAFYFGFLDRRSHFYPEKDESPPSFLCRECQSPSYTEICTFCRIRLKVSLAGRDQDSGTHS